MALPSYNIIENYLGAGNLAAYSFDFKIYDPSQLLVMIQDNLGNVISVVRGTDTTVLYGVTFDPVNGGGLVTLLTPLPTNYTLILLSANDAPTQPSRFINKGDFTVSRVENALDYLGIAVQRLAYLAQLAIRVSDFDELNGQSFNPQFPPGINGLAYAIPTTNALGTAWDLPVNWITKPDIQSALNAAIAAAASAQASASSAANSASSATAATGSNTAAVAAAATAQAAATAAGTSAGQAAMSAGNAQTAAAATASDRTQCDQDALNANQSATNASNSATTAQNNANNAQLYANQAAQSAQQAAQFAIRANVVPIGNGQASLIVTYSTPFPAATSVPVFSFINTADPTPIDLTGKITTFGPNGFTIKFNALTDTGNYSLSYQVSGVV